MRFARSSHTYNQTGSPDRAMSPLMAARVFFRQYKIPTTKQQVLGLKMYIKLRCLTKIMKCWCKLGKMLIHLGDTII